MFTFSITLLLLTSVNNSKTIIVGKQKAETTSFKLNESNRPSFTIHKQPTMVTSEKKNVLGDTVDKRINGEKLTFGVTFSSYENNINELTTLENLLERPISLVSLYVQFGSKNNSLPFDKLSYLREKKVNLLIAWEPWKADEGLRQSKDYLAEITQGAVDDYLKKFAQAVKEYGNTVTIRFAHEMNGNWYPWAGRPLEFKQAFRYIVALFENEKVSNVRWMWSINYNNVPVSPIEATATFYPGDDVVDAIGIDGFNWGSDFNYGGWKSFTEIFQGAYYFVLRYNKPIIISEVASSEIGGDKASWVRHMLRDAIPHDLPAISSIVWFNLLKEADWRIQSSEVSLRSFKENLPL